MESHQPSDDQIRPYLQLLCQSSEPEIRVIMQGDQLQMDVIDGLLLAKNLVDGEILSTHAHLKSCPDCKYRASVGWYYTLFKVHGNLKDWEGPEWRATDWGHASAWEIGVADPILQREGFQVLEWCTISDGYPVIRAVKVLREGIESFLLYRTLETEASYHQRTGLCPRCGKSFDMTRTQGVTMNSSDDGCPECSWGYEPLY